MQPKQQGWMNGEYNYRVLAVQLLSLLKLTEHLHDRQKELDKSTHHHLI